jgi:hypothetical protein
MVVAFAANVNASWNVSADADLRYYLSDWREHDPHVHVLGASVRKTFSDGTGDRLILFGLAEAGHNFSEFMVHELYARLKGPMGAWNITLGRFGLPYGLLTSFSTSRLLYQSITETVLGIDADNGIMVSGTLGAFDYGIAGTQGLGAHGMPQFPGHGLVTGRGGITLGDAEEFAFGLSGAYGKTAHGGHSDIVHERALVGIDATVSLGRTISRVEVSGGVVDRELYAAGFAGVDIAVLPGMDLTIATQLVAGNEYRDAWFLGLSKRFPWFTMRGGYTYGYFGPVHHKISVQAYRLFSLNW